MVVDLVLVEVLVVEALAVVEEEEEVVVEEVLVGVQDMVAASVLVEG